MSRQEGSTMRHLVNAHSVTGQVVYTGRLFLAGPVVPTGKAMVHWIGCINAIPYQTIAIVRRQPVPPNARKRRSEFHLRPDQYTPIHSPGGLVPASFARGT